VRAVGAAADVGAMDTRRVVVLVARSRIARRGAAKIDARGAMMTTMFDTFVLRLLRSSPTDRLDVKARARLDARTYEAIRYMKGYECA
jgi:hypothetical protein